MVFALTDLLAQGARCVREGHVHEGIEAYARAVALDPDHSEAWYNLGWLYRVSRRFEAALDAYGKALAAGIERPEEAHLNRAAILSDHLFRTDAAEAELRAALACNPGFARAWLNLGMLYEDLGRSDAARDAYQAALGIESGNGRARARIAMIDVATGRASAAATRLRAALGTASNAEDRAEMLFALGSALDAEARYDDAFQAFEAANWIARSMASSRYDPVAQERLVDRLISAFPAPLATIPALDTVDDPIFICGMFRSGSTLVEQLLGRHPAIIAGGEREFIPALVQTELRPYPETITQLSAEQLDKWRRACLDELSGADSGQVTDKRCDNFQHLGLIMGLFPNARIIHTVRNPLDNLLSIFFLHFGEGVNYGHDLREAAHYYVQYRRLMAHWQRLFPDAIRDANYDVLVRDPRRSIGDLLAFIDQPWDEAVLTSPAGDAPVRTPSAWAVREPVHTRSSGRWRHYERQLQGARAILSAAGLQ